MTFEEYLKDELQVVFNKSLIKKQFDDVLYDLEQVSRKRSKERQELYKYMDYYLVEGSEEYRYIDSEGLQLSIHWIKTDEEFDKNDGLSVTLHEPVAVLNNFKQYDVIDALWEMYEMFLREREFYETLNK